jgi:hypothetical protein
VTEYTRRAEPEKEQAVTTVEAPATHLQENPFEIARTQLRRVADTFHIDGNLVDVLGQCKKAVEVSIPVGMDDGTTRVFTARRRAASATTRTSRSTRSRRSRCG